ncbi:head decoration protein [Paenibacillus apiarius]|uniref:head decoration protein n=1 Tax=Paenibacillus apiarius TaxID=46240 RepID=UPI003B3A240E
MAVRNENLGTMKYDNLINSSDVALITAMQTIAAGQGALKRGTALALSGGTGGKGTLKILGSAAETDETLVANCVLCDDVDATNEVKAEVYLSGHFNKNALIAKDGYTIKYTDVEDFRKGGIFLDDMMK